MRRTVLKARDDASVKWSMGNGGNETASDPQLAERQSQYKRALTGQSRWQEPSALFERVTIILGGV